MILHQLLQWQVEYKFEFESTKITGELWGVFCEDFEENRPCYNGTALYVNIVFFSQAKEEEDYLEWLKSQPKEDEEKAGIEELVST